MVIFTEAAIGTGMLVDSEENHRRESLLTNESKILTFLLGSEEYGLSIREVKEIFGYVNVTAIPQSPPHVKGVINLRGQVISVIDLRVMFDMEPAEVTQYTCIIVLETEVSRKCTAGIIVDKVMEVGEFPCSDIVSKEKYDGRINAKYIAGVAKLRENKRILLDTVSILRDGENIKIE